MNKRTKRDMEMAKLQKTVLGWIMDIDQDQWRKFWMG